MTGEEALFLVWVFLGYIFLVCAYCYLRAERRIKKLEEYLDGLQKMVWALERIDWPTWGDKPLKEAKRMHGWINDKKTT